MKVLTSSGFGQIPAELLLACGDPVEVIMDNPSDPLGAKQTMPKDQVYEFGDFAVIRVVGVEGNSEPCSNVLPFVMLAEAEEFYDAPCPGGETRFLLNLADGTFQVNRELGRHARPYLRINPWLDRWAPERGMIEDFLATSVTAYGRSLEGLAGTAGGIHMPVLLDIGEGRILRVAIIAMACRGVIFDKRFGC